MHAIAHAYATKALHGAATARKITIEEARFYFRALGMSLRKTEFGEFRINFRHGAESTAAYEDDLPAAIGTGLAMIAHKCRMERNALAHGIPADIAARDALALAMGA